MSNSPHRIPQSPKAKRLVERLEDGWNRIEVARARGEDVTAWEDFWINLLHEYESVEDLDGRGR